MAQNTASPIAEKTLRYTSRGKRRGTPKVCIGCGGGKKRQDLFCKSCRALYRASRKAEQELDDLFDEAIASET